MEIKDRCIDLQQQILYGLHLIIIMAIEEKPSNQEKSPTKRLKPDQKNIFEDKRDQSKIADAQKSTKGNGSAAIVIILISIYGATMIFCFALMSFSLVTTESKDILTLIITSQVVLIGSAIGFYFGKNS